MILFRSPVDFPKKFFFLRSLIISEVAGHEAQVSFHTPIKYAILLRIFSANPKEAYVFQNQDGSCLDTCLPRSRLQFDQHVQRKTDVESTHRWHTYRQAVLYA